MPIPAGLANIRERYGNPRDKDGSLNEHWAEDNLEYVDFPYPMRLAWDTHVTVKRTRVHRLLAKDVAHRLAHIWAYARAVIKDRDGYKRTSEYYDEQALKWLQAQGLDLFGGCFEFRMQRGVNVKLSTHCWGIALDFNPARNAMGTKGNMPDWFVYVWTKSDPDTGINWVWGGTFEHSDPMHFQACKGY